MWSKNQAAPIVRAKVEGGAHSTRFRRDALSAYLAKLGEAPLLTQAEESAFAKRVEDAELAVARALVRSPAAARELAAIGEDLREGTAKARELTRRPIPSDDDAAERQWAEEFQAFVGALVGARERSQASRRSFESALQALRPGRALLERVVRALHAQLPEHADPSSGPTDAKALAELRATLATLRTRQRAADHARGRLVQANLRLVVSIAKKHVGTECTCST